MLGLNKILFDLISCKSIMFLSIENDINKFPLEMLGINEYQWDLHMNDS